ncbi:MAG: HEAT repeat domain-containing protein, partial [Candidatus Omnitrophota bacterium]
EAFAGDWIIYLRSLAREDWDRQRQDNFIKKYRNPRMTYEDTLFGFMQEGIVPRGRDNSEFNSMNKQEILDNLAKQMKHMTVADLRALAKRYNIGVSKDNDNYRNLPRLLLEYFVQMEADALRQLLIEIMLSNQILYEWVVYRVDSVQKTATTSVHASLTAYRVFLKHLLRKRLNREPTDEEIERELINYNRGLISYEPRRSEERNGNFGYTFIENLKDDGWVEAEWEIGGKPKERLKTIATMGGRLDANSDMYANGWGYKVDNWTYAIRHIPDDDGVVFNTDWEHTIFPVDVFLLPFVAYEFTKRKDLGILLTDLRDADEGMTSTAKDQTVAEDVWNTRIIAALTRLGTPAWYGPVIVRLPAMRNFVVNSSKIEDSTSAHEILKRGYKADFAPGITMGRGREKNQGGMPAFVNRFGGLTLFENSLSPHFQQLLASNKLHWTEKLTLILNDDHYITQVFIPRFNLMIFLFAFFVSFTPFAYLAIPMFFISLYFIFSQAITAGGIRKYVKEHGFWKGWGLYMRRFWSLVFTFVSLIPNDSQKTLRALSGESGVFAGGEKDVKHASEPFITFDPRPGNDGLYEKFRQSIKWGVLLLAILLVAPLHPFGVIGQFFFLIFPFAFIFGPFIWNGYSLRDSLRLGLQPFRAKWRTFSQEWNSRGDWKGKAKTFFKYLPDIVTSLPILNISHVKMIIHGLFAIVYFVVVDILVSPMQNLWTGLRRSIKRIIDKINKPAEKEKPTEEKKGPQEETPPAPKEEVSPPALQITTPISELPNAEVGQFYSFDMQATGGVAPYAWKLLEGSLPEGLQLDTNSGRISGIPVTEGEYLFTPAVTDSVGNQVSKPFVLKVNPAIMPTGPPVEKKKPVPPATPYAMAYRYRPYYGYPYDSKSAVSKIRHPLIRLIDEMNSVYKTMAKQLRRESSKHNIAIAKEKLAELDRIAEEKEIVEETDNARRSLRRAIYKAQRELRLPRRLRKVIRGFLKGRFNQENPLHMYLGFRLLKLQAILEGGLIELEDLSYDDYVKLIEQPSVLEDTLTDKQSAEMLYLAWEARRIREFIDKLRQRYPNRPIMVVGNLTYGGIAISPIKEELESEGIRVVFTKAGSYENHHNSRILYPFMFTCEELRFILREQPTVVVIDGSNSVTDVYRTCPHYPDAYQSYRNYFLALEAIINSDADISKFGVSKEFLENLRRSKEFKRLEEKVSTLLHAPPQALGYSLSFWYPGWKHLKVRLDKQPLDVPIEKDLCNRQDPNNPRFEILTSPSIIFVESGIENELIPQEVKSLANNREHDACYYDDDIERSIFTEPFIYVDQRGPHLMSRGSRLARERYNLIKDIPIESTPISPHRVIKEMLSDRDIKAIVLDFDKTLVPVDSKLSRYPDLINILISLLEQGLDIVIITEEREERLERRFLDVIPAHLKQNLHIFSNGGARGFGFDEQANKVSYFTEVVDLQQRQAIEQVIKTVLPTGSYTILPRQNKVKIELDKGVVSERVSIAAGLKNKLAQANIQATVTFQGKRHINIYLFNKVNALDYYLTDNPRVGEESLLIIGDAAVRFGADRELLSSFPEALSINVGHTSRSIQLKNPNIIQGFEGIFVTKEVLQILKAQKLEDSRTGYDEGMEQTEVEEDCTKGDWISRHSLRTSWYIWRLSNSNPRVREAACQALGELGNKGAIPALIKASCDSDQRVRESAFQALEKLDATKEEMLAGYLEATENPDSVVRCFACQALGNIGDQRAVPKLIDKLNDPDPHVRQASAEALGNIGDRRAVSPLFATLTNDSNSFVQVSACQALGKFSDDARVIPGLIERLNAILADIINYPRTSVCIAICQALGNLGDQRAISVLKEIFADSQLRPSLREASRQALNRINLLSIGAKSNTKAFARLQQSNPDLLQTKVNRLKQLKSAGMINGRNGGIPVTLLRYSVETVERRAAILDKYGYTLNSGNIRLKNEDEVRQWVQGKKKSDSNTPTGRQTKESYLARIAQLSSQGRVRTIPKDELRFEMTPEDIQRYFTAIREVLTERNQSVVNPEILFEAARRALEGRTSQVKARIALQPGTMNPLTYGHITAGLAAIIDKQINRVILANGGTVPDKPYAASADIRNEMANVATEDPGLSDWLLVTPVRAQAVDMFESRGESSLLLSGADENTRRFNMDMAAFIWLFVANPNAEWFYIVGADKLVGYNRERNLIEHTLYPAGVKVLYFSRAEAAGFSYQEHIQAYPWLDKLWQEGLFVASGIPSFEDVSATKVRYAFAYNEDTIDGLPLSEMIPQGLVEHMRQNPELLSLYRIEFLEKEADSLTKQGKTQEANAKYQQAIDMIDQLTSSGSTTTEASFQILRDNLAAKIGKLKPFPPANVFARYQDLVSSFDDNLECSLDLSRKKGERFSPLGAKSADLAKLLNLSLDTLDILVKRNPELNAYYQELLKSPDNRAPPIIIRVSSRLPVDSARYYATHTKQVEIILNSDFVKDLLKFSEQYPVVRYMLAERLFHELGHTNRLGSPEEERQEEANLIIRDTDLHYLILGTRIESKGPVVETRIIDFIREAQPEYLSRESAYFGLLSQLLPLLNHDRIDKIHEYLQEQYDLLSLTDEDIEAMSVHDLSHFIEDFDLSQSIFNLAQKFLLYSAAPGTGKGAVWDAAFNPKTGGSYAHLIDRLILYHTRQPRVSDRVSEKDGVAYHFRDRDTLRKLEAEGKIITTLVNNQLQGLAMVDFEEELVIEKADLADDRPSTILETDQIVFEDERIIVIRRQIRGLSSVFSGEKLVILEGGYGWFYALKKDARYKDRYKDVLVIFISPYNDQEIQVRANNTKIIDGHFKRPAEKAAAYLELYNLISQTRGEIDLEKSPSMLRLIVSAAARNAAGLSGTTSAVNAAVIESRHFLDDIFVAPSPTLNKDDLGSIKAQRQSLSDNDIAIIKAMAYEVYRRLTGREREIRFSLSKRRMPEGVEDREYDRYQRVLEGVRQVIWKNQYPEVGGLVLDNPWGWTQEARNTLISNLTNDFSHALFAHVVRAMRDETRTCDLKMWPERRFEDSERRFEDSIKRNLGYKGLWPAQEELAARLLREEFVELEMSGGKTLGIILAAYRKLKEFRGRQTKHSIFVATANELLANRDAHTAASVLTELGVKVGYLAGEDRSYIWDANIGKFREVSRQEVYAQANIIYGLISTFAFDYLRDMLAYSQNEQLQISSKWYVLFDEAHTLKEYALTPFIISGRQVHDAEKRVRLRKEANTLAVKVFKSNPAYYKVDKNRKRVDLTTKGRKYLDALGKSDLEEYVEMALTAHECYEKRVDYCVFGQVIIIDPISGEGLEGRRWSFGLHSAIEAKEGLKVNPETQILAQITLPELLKSPHILSFAGTSGTIDEAVVKEIYTKTTSQIDNGTKTQREDKGPSLYSTQKESLQAAVNRILEIAKQGRPLLIKVGSPKKAEELRDLLAKHIDTKRISLVTALNSTSHEAVNRIIEKAGRPNKVTIVTAVGGSGIDISLTEEVKRRGGLYAISTYCEENLLVDYQFRGRTARNGNPGVWEGFWSLEDRLFREYGADLAEEASKILTRRASRGPLSDKKTIEIVNILRQRIAQQKIRQIRELGRLDSLIHNTWLEFLIFRQGILEGKLFAGLPKDVREALSQAELEELRNKALLIMDSQWSEFLSTATEMRRQLFEFVRHYDWRQQFIPVSTFAEYKGNLKHVYKQTLNNIYARIGQEIIKPIQDRSKVSLEGLGSNRQNKSTLRNLVAKLKAPAVIIAAAATAIIGLFLWRQGFGLINGSWLGDSGIFGPEAVSGLSTIPVLGLAALAIITTIVTLILRHTFVNRIQAGDRSQEEFILRLRGINEGNTLKAHLKYPVNQILNLLSYLGIIGAAGLLVQYIVQPISIMFMPLPPFVVAAGSLAPVLAAIAGVVGLVSSAILCLINRSTLKEVPFVPIKRFQRVISGFSFGLIAQISAALLFSHLIPGVNLIGLPMLVGLGLGVALYALSHVFARHFAQDRIVEWKLVAGGLLSSIAVFAGLSFIITHTMFNPIQLWFIGSLAMIGFGIHTVLAGKKYIQGLVSLRDGINTNRNSPSGRLTSIKHALGLIFEASLSNLTRFAPITLGVAGLITLLVTQGIGLSFLLSPISLGLIALFIVTSVIISRSKPKYAGAVFGSAIAASLFFSAMSAPAYAQATMLDHQLNSNPEYKLDQVDPELIEAAQQLLENMNAQQDQAYNFANSENIAEFYERGTLIQETDTGLLASHGGDARLVDWAMTYDQALGVIVFARGEDFAGAKEILEFYQAQYDAQRQAGMPFNGFASAYGVKTGQITEYKYEAGPNAWLGIAILQYSQQTRDDTYLALAESIGEWLAKLQNEDGGIRASPGVWRLSTEQNIDAYVFFKMLYEVTGEQRYSRISEQIYNWIEDAYNPETGVFNRGIKAEFDAQGNIMYESDTIFATDVQAMAVMAFGVKGLGQMGVDVERLLAVSVEKAATTVDYVMPSGTQVEQVTGFDFDDQKDMISSEWTAQMAIAYQIAGDSQRANYYLEQLEMMLYKGTLPYATKENADTGHEWNTPFGKISLAGMEYYYLAKYGDNPFTLRVEGTGFDLEQIMVQQRTLTSDDYPLLIRDLRFSDAQNDLTSAQGNLDYIIWQIKQAEDNLIELKQALQDVLEQLLFVDADMDSLPNRAGDYKGERIPGKGGYWVWLVTDEDAIADITPDMSSLPNRPGAYNGEYFIGKDGRWVWANIPESELAQPDMSSLPNYAGTEGQRVAGQDGDWV